MTRPHRNSLVIRSSDPTRPDLVTAERIEVAIHFLEFLGADAAFAYLHEHGVNPELAKRVLLSPTIRRQTKSRLRAWTSCQLWRVLRKLGALSGGKARRQPTE